MRKIFLLVCISGLLSGFTLGQTERGKVDLSEIPGPLAHYLPEYTFDRPADNLKWNLQSNGLHAVFGSTDELYLRCEVPDIRNDQLSWEVSGWRGERLNTQIVVWSPDSLKQIRLIAGDLLSQAGNRIDKSNIRIRLVRYVVSNFPYGATAQNCDSRADSAWLMPDRLEDMDRFDLPGRSVRSVWLTVDIPGETESGEYSGIIKVESLKEKSSLQVKIRVQKLRLPEPHDWSFRLDLWQNPWVIARYYQVAPWSAEHIAMLRKHLKLYADAGGKYVTTYAVYSPWSDNSYHVEGTMIDWVKTVKGEWRFDYSIFDRYVELAGETGIDKAITIYTPIPWGYRFRYTDENTGNYVYEEWSPSSDQFRRIWNIFLDDLRDHLQKKGWLDRTYLGINENPIDITRAAVKVIRENSKEWKITYAGDWNSDISPMLDDYSSVISKEPVPAEISKRTSQGYTSSFYVCCTPSRPNNFVFSPPVEGRYLGWHAAAYGYNGFLRWAYDAWPADPVRDARHVLWPAGDCFLVYPGGNSSIRFEKLREGIADYEKIRILRSLVNGSPGGQIKKLINDLEIHLSTLLDESDFNRRDYSIEKITAAVKRGKEIIDDLSEVVNNP